MLKRVCDICGRIITDDIVVVKDEWDWDLCPYCVEKEELLIKTIQEQKAAAKESFEAEDKEWGTMEERCHEETIIESAPNALQCMKDRILEAKRKLREM